MRHALFLSAALAALLSSGAATANGRFPAANQLVGTPGKPDQLVLRATFGVLISNDRGKTWDWICERAIGYGNVWDPPIGVFANGAIMAGTIDGLSHSPDHGCGWSFATGVIDKRAIVDVVVRPSAPSSGFALGSSNGGEDDAGAQLFRTEVFVTYDSGYTFALSGNTFEPTFVAQTIEVAPSATGRVYISGSIGERGVLYVSDDGGSSYTLRDVPMEKPKERHPFIAAVDPTNPDRVFVRTSGTSSRLLVSDDAGKTYRTVLSGPPLVGFALSPDGKRVWVGDTAALHTASTTDFAFEKVSSEGVQCLYATDAALYACMANTTLGYAVGISTDSGRSFKPLLAFPNIRGPLTCTGNATVNQCAEDWPATKRTLEPLTAGSTDAGTVGPSGRLTGPYKASGGCNASATAAIGVSAGAGAFAAFGGLALLLRRRARRRS